MERRSISLTRLLTSIALIVFGLGFMVLAYGYGLGTPINFGPGLFPFLFGAVLAATAAVDVAQVARDENHDFVAAVEPRRLICVCLSLLAFGALLGTAGFIPAVFATTAVAMRAEPTVRWLTLFLYSLALSAVCYVVFLVVLGIPVAAFG